jgi:hypothetical protein
MTACPHGMPSPASCWECMEEGNLPAAPRPRPPEREGPSFPARYEGTHCRGCNLEIHVGQPIVRTTHGHYVHDRCVT